MTAVNFAGWLPTPRGAKNWRGLAKILNMLHLLLMLVTKNAGMRTATPVGGDDRQRIRNAWGDRSRPRSCTAESGQKSGNARGFMPALPVFERRSFRRALSRRRPAEGELRDLDEALTAVVGAVLQESSRAAGTIIGVATSKLVAATVAAGTFGAIGTFGVASTGTAIATLSGGAATTATLYWIGSSIGMGVAAGGFMLTGGAVVVGIPAAIAARRWLLGRRRTANDLTEAEQAALYAALRLAAVVRVARARAAAPSPVEMRILAREGLTPLVSALKRLYLTEPEDEGEDPCAVRSGSLACWQRRRLRLACGRIASMAAKWSHD